MTLFLLMDITQFSPLMFAAYTAICSSGSSPKAVSAEDILIAEGTATLELADQQVCTRCYWLFC